MRSWILHGSSLCEVPIPANTPHLRSSTDVCIIFFRSPLFFLFVFIQFLQKCEELFTASRCIYFMHWCGGVPWKSRGCCGMIFFSPYCFS
jgi:hypothetical protein